MRKIFLAALVAAALAAGFQPVPQIARANSPADAPKVCTGTPPAVALVPVTSPSMEREVQDDQLLVYDRYVDIAAPGGVLDQLKAAGVNVIRVNVLHVKGDEPLAPIWGTDTGGGPWGLTLNADMPTYKAAIEKMVAKGFKVEVTLVWYGQSDPDALCNWMTSVAWELSPLVFRFSILNEPDLNLWDVDACNTQDINKMIRSGTLKVKRVRVNVYKRIPHFHGRRFKRVRRVRGGKHKFVYKRSHHGNYRRVKAHRYKRIPRFHGWRYRRIKIHTSTGRRKFIYRRSHRGKYRRVRRYRRVAVSGANTRYEDMASAATGCLRIRQGWKYRRIVQKVAPAIREVTPPGTQVAAGDTSPGTGVLLFIGAATGDSDGKGPLPVDLWLHHPYVGFEGGIYNCQAVKAAAGMPLGFDEFGLDVNWPDRTNALKRAWQQAGTCGVVEMSQYQLNTPGGSGWNTSLGGDLSWLSYIMQP